MSCNPSVQPSITRLRPNLEGLPRGSELSKSLPSVVQPELCAVTVLVAEGCTLPCLVKAAYGRCLQERVLREADPREARRALKYCEARR